MNLEKHYKEIEENGFTMIPGMVNADLTGRMKNRLKEVMVEDLEKWKGRPSKLPELVVELVRYGPEFAELLENDVMHSVFSHFLSDQCIAYCYNSAIMPPNKNTLACKVHVDTNFFIPDYFPRLQLMLALDDITLENGATYFLPGSHKTAGPPSDEEFFANAVQVTRKAGDAVFFSTRCYHAGAPNHTDNTRYAIGLQACRHWMKQRFDYPQLLSPELASSLSDRAKRFLGYYSRVPVNEEQFYVSPEERLYKANLGQPNYADPAAQ